MRCGWLRSLLCRPKHGRGGPPSTPHRLGAARAQGAHPCFPPLPSRRFQQERRLRGKESELHHLPQRHLFGAETASGRCDRLKGAVAIYQKHPDLRWPCFLCHPWAPKAEEGSTDCFFESGTETGLAGGTTLPLPVTTPRTPSTGSGSLRSFPGTTSGKSAPNHTTRKRKSQKHIT